MATGRRQTGLILLLGLLALPAGTVGAVEIKLAHPVPDGSLWDRVLDEMGAEWRDATGGEVKLIVFAGGVAGPDDTVIRKLRLGQLHAASLSYIGLTALEEAFEVFTIPLLFDSYEEFFCVLDKLEPVLRQRLEAKGMILLSWGLGGWAYFFTKSPVYAVADIKQMPMFTAAGDPEIVQIFRRKGFKPVALAATDIMSGLQTGMFEAHQLSRSMRGSVVPPAILSQALAEREACRQRNSSADTPAGENNQFLGALSCSR